MQRINSVDGLFHEGNPAIGQKGTKVTEDFFNDLQEEICNVIEGAGIDLAGATRDQLLRAIQIFSGNTVTRVVNASGNVQPNDSVLLVDASAAPVVLTLRPAGSISSRALIVVKIDANSDNPVTLQPTGGDTICRSDSINLTTQDDVFKCIPDLVNNWIKL